MSMTPEEHREYMRKYAKEWRKNNPERARVNSNKSTKKWRANNPDKVRKQNRARNKKWREDNPQKYYEQKRNHHLRHTFGITLQHYNDLLLAQGGVCAICGVPDQTDGRIFHVDHCHETGVIRGLLCHKCNPALGLLKDDPAILRAAADYLEAANARANA